MRVPNRIDERVNVPWNSFCAKQKYIKIIAKNVEKYKKIKFKKPQKYKLITHRKRKNFKYDGSTQGTIFFWRCFVPQVAFSRRFFVLFVLLRYWVISLIISIISQITWFNNNIYNYNNKNMNKEIFHIYCIKLHFFKLNIILIKKYIKK